MTTQKEISIRPVAADDLTAVAHLHCQAFPKSFLTALGPSAVRRYYEWQLKGPHDVYALAAMRDSQLAGYCFGGIFRGSLSGFIRKNIFYLLLELIKHPGILFHPDLTERLQLGWKSFKSSFKQKDSNQQVENEKMFGILAIGINPQLQRQGLGQILMDESEKVARKKLFAKMTLTVHPSNIQAVNFYEKLGWYKFPSTSEWKGQMRKNLES